MTRFNELDQLVGKTVERIDRDEHDEFVAVHFTDGTIWLAVAQRWNCAGARLWQTVGRRFGGQTVSGESDGGKS